MLRFKVNDFEVQNLLTASMLINCWNICYKLNSLSENNLHEENALNTNFITKNKSIFNYLSPNQFIQLHGKQILFKQIIHVSKRLITFWTHILYGKSCLQFWFNFAEIVFRTHSNLCLKSNISFGLLVFIFYSCMIWFNLVNSRS